MRTERKDREESNLTLYIVTALSITESTYITKSEVAIVLLMKRSPTCTILSFGKDNWILL